MKGTKIIFRAAKDGFAGKMPYEGVILDSIKIEKELYRKAEYGSLVYEKTVVVTAYVVKDEYNKVHTIFPEDISKIK